MQVLWCARPGGTSAHCDPCSACCCVVCAWQGSLATTTGGALAAHAGTTAEHIAAKERRHAPAPSPASTDIMSVMQEFCGTTNHHTPQSRWAVYGGKRGIPPKLPAPSLSSAPAARWGCARRIPSAWPLGEQSAAHSLHTQTLLSAPSALHAVCERPSWTWQHVGPAGHWPV